MDFVILSISYWTRGVVPSGCKLGGTVPSGGNYRVAYGTLCCVSSRLSRQVVCVPELLQLYDCATGDRTFCVWSGNLVAFRYFTHVLTLGW